MLKKLKFVVVMLCSILKPPVTLEQHSLVIHLVCCFPLD